MSDKYILDGHTPIPCESVIEWSRWFETARLERFVAKTTLEDGSRVSTVFLGLDHNYDDGPPLLFETLVFGGPHDGEQERYSTWEEAEVGHAAMLERVKESA